MANLAPVNTAMFKGQPKSFFTLDSFKRGVITLIDQSRLPKDALKEADNIFLYEDGMPGPRPGVDWYGTAPTSSAIDGFDYFDFNGAIHLVAAAGGTIYRSTDNGTSWLACTAATYTAGQTCFMNQSSNFLYITNGTDNIIRYDGSSVLQTYTTLSTPSAPTTALTTLTAGSYNNYYKIAAVNGVGTSIASATSTLQTTNLERSLWTTTSYVTVTGAVVASATAYNFYYSNDNVNFYYFASSTTPVIADTGQPIVTNSTAPTANTTQGPKVTELTNVGERMYGVRDTVNRYRIWFTGAGTNDGNFSEAYDGGFIDWQPGGKFLPVKVEDYRDGRGSPVATVWCKSADGQGCILQLTLDTVTIGDYQITEPSIYRLPGSRGTPAPGSVVNVLNDYFFYNSQAIYNLGPRAQFLQILSTDEASANIRPTIKQISQIGETNISSVYYDAKVYFSVPYGSTTNNYTAVYDTERRAWLPKAFNLGFKKFLRYTDTDGTPHLLALKPGDTRLSEISSSLQGDYDVAFSTSLVTGLYPVLRNRFDFQRVLEGEIELSNPAGSISVELIGIERTRGYSAQNTETITPTLTTTGWSTFDWSTMYWSDTTDVPSTFSESSVKRYFRVNRELNAIQWRITTSSLDAGYVLRTLQTNGRATMTNKPRQWRIG